MWEQPGTMINSQPPAEEKVIEDGSDSAYSLYLPHLSHLPVPLLLLLKLLTEFEEEQELCP